MKAEEPHINEDGYLLIREGRHPDRRKESGAHQRLHRQDYRTLVVTGPNTGGKTVTLKTIGLLALMAQAACTFRHPARARSPSLMMSLLTSRRAEVSSRACPPSSHMKNIVRIAEEADADSLVLLDELGGRARIRRRARLSPSPYWRTSTRESAMTAATTHYNEIKKYALSTDGVENASMEFNVETLSPTYRLTIGIPGKSNAFEISKKLGLSETLIDRAGTAHRAGDIEFEDVISAIEADKKKAEEERDEAIMINNLAMKKKQEEIENRWRILQRKRKDDCRCQRRGAGDPQRRQRDGQ